MEPLSPLPEAPTALPLLPPRERRVWLDRLPPQVCAYIASFMKSTSFQAVYNFANVSPVLRGAMKSAFEHRLDLEYVESECQKSLEYSWDRGVLPTWLETDCYALVGDDVREVRLSGSLLYPQGVQECFKSPELTKLVIQNRPCEFGLLRHMSNLRALEMTRVDFPKFKPFLKRMSIPILDLQELSLESSMTKCLHKDFVEDVENHSLLASWFPRVEKLSLQCGKCEYSEESSTALLWDAIEKFQELKEVTITEDVPEHAIERLQQMDRVTVTGGDHFALAEKLSCGLVSISKKYVNDASYQQLLDDRHLFDRLEWCTQLEHFSCWIPSGAETGLVKIMKNLRSLFLGFQTYPDEIISRDQDLCVVGDPNTDAILAALRHAPHLKDVNFAPSILIRAKTMCDMLRILGDRLEKFSATIFPWNSKEAAHDVEATREELDDILQVLKTIAIHNPSLNSLWLDSSLLQSRDNYLMDCCLAQQTILPVLPAFRATASVLQRRTPRLDMLWLKRLLRRFTASCSQQILPSEESDWSDSSGAFV